MQNCSFSTAETSRLKRTIQQAYILASVNLLEIQIELPIAQPNQEINSKAKDHDLRIEE